MGSEVLMKAQNFCLFKILLAAIFFISPLLGAASQQPTLARSEYIVESSGAAVETSLELPTPDGQGILSISSSLSRPRVSLAEGPALSQDRLRLALSFKYEPSEGLIAPALIDLDGGLYRFLPADGDSEAEILRSGGAWDSVSHTGHTQIEGGRWYCSEIEVVRQSRTRTWSLRIWAKGSNRPEEAEYSAVESFDQSPSPLRAGFWTSGDGLRQARDLQTSGLVARGSLVPESGKNWPLAIVDGAIEFDSPAFAKKKTRIELKSLDSTQTSTPEAARGKLATSFACDAYYHHFGGYAPGHPDSWAALRLPPVDNDCDGAFNEDPWNWRDDDGDGLVDEDNYWGDSYLNWSSEDDVMGGVATGDHGAIILFYRHWWPVAEDFLGFATISGENWLGGAVRISPLSGGVATLGHGWSTIEYLLSPVSVEPLELEVLESGVEFEDGRYYARSVVFTAETSGGSGVVETSASIDGQTYILGESYVLEGEHLLHVEASDSSETLSVDGNFGIDTTPPSFDGIAPLAGALIGVEPVVLSGSVSADTVSLSVAGIGADLDPPSGEWRGFSSAPIDLDEGLNNIELIATDDLGWQTTLQHSLDLDTLPPTIAFDSPADGALFGTSPAAVGGVVSDAHLETVVVDGGPAAVAGGRFSAEAALIEGENIIVAHATDALNRTSDAEISLVLDTTAPDVDIDTPAPGSVLDAEIIVVGGSVSDPYLAGVRVADIDGDVSGDRYTVENVPLIEGANQLAATAWDEVDNSYTSPSIVLVRDTLAPELSIDELPTLTDSPTLSVGGDVDDPHLASVFVNGSEATVSSGRWVFSALQLIEGENLVTAVATDSLDHQTEISAGPVVLDSLAPEIAILVPADGEGFDSTTVHIEGSLSDPHLDPATVSVNGAPAIIDGGSFSVDLELPEGDTVLTATAADILGHTSFSEPVAIVVDTLAPVVTLTEPMEVLVATPTISLMGTVDDPHLQSVFVDDVEAVVADGSFVVDGVSLVEGENALVAIATDAFDHSAESNAVLITLDTVPPELNIDSPSEGQILGEGSVLVAGSVVDLHPGFVWVNGVSTTPVDGRFSIEIQMPEGGGEILVEAFDVVDNLSTQTIGVLVDSLAPVVTIDQPAFAAGECSSGGPISVAGRYSDSNPASGSSALSLGVVDSGGIEAMYTPVLLDEQWSVAGVVLGAVDGSALLSAIGVDAAGHETRVVKSVVVDVSAPTLELRADASPFPGAAPGEVPAAGEIAALISRSIAARVLVADGASPAPPVEISLDGVPYLEGSPIEAEGEHLLVARAVDCGGNVGAVHALFELDLTAPILLSSSPADGALLSEGPASLTGAASTDLVEAFVDDIPAVIGEGGVFSLTPLSWQEGANHLTIRLKDLAGNESESELSFSVDSAAPVISIEVGGFPVAADAVYTSVVVPEIVVDDPEASLSLSLDGASYVPGSPIESEGAHILHVEAEDLLGRTSTAEASFEIDLSDGPQISILSPENGAILTEIAVDISGSFSNAESITINDQPAVLSGGSFSLSGFALEDGVMNTLVAVATDNRGRRAMDLVDVFLRAEPGQILITEPLDGSVTPRAATDVAGFVVGGAVMTSDGHITVEGILSEVGIDGDFRVKDIPLQEGPNQLSAAIVDSEGRDSSVVVSVVSDQSPPILSLLAEGDELEENAVLAAPASVEIQASDDGSSVESLEVSLNGESVDLVGAEASLSLEIEGGYSLIADAVDEVGNRARIERHFVVGGGCAISALEPGDGSVFTLETISIRGDAQRAVGISLITEGGVEYPAALNDTSFVVGDVPLAPGENRFVLRCRDAAGEQGEQSLLLNRLAGDGPVVTLTSPSDGAVVDMQSVLVEGTLDDPEAELFSQGSPVLTTPDGQGGATFGFERVLAEGPNLITATAVDAGGRKGVDRVLVARDSRAPALVVTSPSDGSHIGPDGEASAQVDVSGLVDLSTEAHFDHIVVGSAVGSVTASVDLNTGVFHADGVALDPSVEGAQILSVEAVDTLGHSSTIEVEVFFDSEWPGLRLAEPVDQQLLEASVTDVDIHGEAWAREGAVIRVNGVAIDPNLLTWSDPDAFGRKHVEFSTSVEAPSEDGALVIAVRVVELDGAFAQARRTVLSDGVGPEIVEIIPGDGATGVAPSTQLMVLFSENVSAASLSAADGLSLLRISTGEEIAGSIFRAGPAVAFIPAVELSEGESYRFRAGLGIRDLFGNPITEAGEATLRILEGGGLEAPILDPIQETLCVSTLLLKGSAGPGLRLRVRTGDLSFSATVGSDGRFSINVPIAREGYHLLLVETVGALGEKSPAVQVVVRNDCSGPRVLGADLDPSTARVLVDMSEEIDPLTATLGGSGAAVRLFDISDGVEQSAVLSVDGLQLSLQLDTDPEAWWRSQGLRLIVGAPLADLGGRQMESVFDAVLGGNSSQGGETRVGGQTFDDSSGRPLADVLAELFPSGSVLSECSANSSTPTAVDISDDKGRYRFAESFEAGRWTIRLSKAGYLPVLRRMDLDPALGHVAFDARLTPRSPRAGILDPNAGGIFVSPEDPGLSLEIDPAAIGGEGPLDLFLTPRSGQGLPAILPLGYTPVAVVSLDLVHQSGATLGAETVFAEAGVRLSLPLPSWADTSAPLIVAAYDACAGVWRRMAPLSLDTEGRAAFSLESVGNFAVLSADEEAEIAPPAVADGEILIGAVPPESYPEFEADLVIDPPVVLPTERAVARVVARSSDGETLWPAGLAVQALIDERLELSGGGEQYEAPFTTDLILYRPVLASSEQGVAVDGAAGALESVISPSARAAETSFNVGWENIRLYPFAGSLIRGNMIGALGGSVLSSDEVEIFLPEGAVSADTIVQAELLGDDELGALPQVEGYTILAAVRLDFEGTTLMRPARLRLPTPESTPAPVASRVILGLWHDFASDGRGAFAELCSRMERLPAGDGHPQRLSAAPEPESSALPLEGIVEEGLYLVLAADLDLAFATGNISDQQALPLAGARVRSAGLQTAAMSAPAGRYNLPVIASGAEIVAVGPLRDESVSQSIAPHPPAAIIPLDLQILPSPPVVETLTPLDGAVDVLLGTQIQILFSEALDPSSVGPQSMSVELANAEAQPTGAMVRGETRLSEDGLSLIFEHYLPLPAGQLYIAHFVGGVRDLDGTSYTGGPIDWSFATSSVTVPDGRIHPEKFHVGIPDDEGHVDFWASSGAVPTVPAGATPWAISPHVVYPGVADDPVVETYSVNDAGGLATRSLGHPPEFPISVEAEIWVRVFDPAGDLAAHFRTGPFSTPDGRGFVAPVDTESSFTTADDVTVRVPAGAFSRPTMISLTPLDVEDIGVENDLSLGIAGYYRVEFEGKASKSLTLEVPAPADAPLDAKVLVGQPRSVAWGRRLRLTSLGGVVEKNGARYLSNADEVQPQIPDLSEGGGKAGSGEQASLWQGFTEAGEAAWYYQQEGQALALMTFMAPLSLNTLVEAFYNLSADSWFYQASSEDWSGQVVLPVVPGAELSIEGRDTATGWLLNSQDYGVAEDPDGDGLIILEAMLGPQPGPPRILGARPFDLLFFSPPSKGESERLRLDLVAETSDKGILSIHAAEGYELPGGMSMSLIDPTKPLEMKLLAGPAFVCSGGDRVSTAKAVDASTPELMAQIGPGELDAVTAGDFTFTFSTKIGADFAKTPVEELVKLWDVGDADNCGGGGTGSPELISLETMYGARSLLVHPVSGLRSNRSYELKLITKKLFPEQCGGDQAQGSFCAAPKVWRFSTGETGGQVVATGGGAQGQVRSIQRIGNLLFSGTLEGDLRATDLAGGASGAVGEHAAHAEMRQGAVRSIRTLATDGHGRLFFAGEYGGIWAVKTIAIEDVEATEVGDEFGPRGGSVRVAYAPGADLGSLSEMMAQSGLRQAIPVDLDVLVRDVETPSKELVAFCEENGCTDELEDEPDSMGVYHLSAQNIPGVDIPQEPSGCSNDAGQVLRQRITLDNLDTGQNFSVEVAPGAAATIAFTARKGDRLRIRHNVSAIGYLALVGAGVAVVDLNKAYDNPNPVTFNGFLQCGRGLGLFSGADIDFSSCSGGMSDGIRFTSSLEVVPPTERAVSEEGQPPQIDGAGSIHVYSPLMHRGLIHSHSPDRTPGSLEGARVPICMRGIGELSLRDVEVVAGTSWIDRGLESFRPGEPFKVINADRFKQPERVNGDLLFLSGGRQGVYVFSISKREPRLIGHLKKGDHTAFRLQAEKDLGLLFAGGWGGVLDLWSFDGVNTAPPEEIQLSEGQSQPAPPTPQRSFTGVPWPADRLGIDSATGLLYTWADRDRGVVAIPYRAPTMIAAGVFRGEGEIDPNDPDAEIPREIRPTSIVVPLGIPTRYSLSEQKSELVEDQKKYTSAFKIRVALPGNLGETLGATIESLRLRPTEDLIAEEDLGAMKTPPSPVESLKSEQKIRLKRLADRNAGVEGRFGQTYNFYESEEIVLVLADPRAVEEYEPQGKAAGAGDPKIDSEAGQCRNCERPEYLRDSDDVVEIFAGGPYLRIRLDVEEDPTLKAYFEDRWKVPASVVRLAGWADDEPSPKQVSLAEPVLNPAMWSPGEGGVSASLVSGESLYGAVDHSTRGRGVDFSFARSYRSGVLSYNPLGTGGWTANLFAHLRENRITGEVEYHDGAGNVWRLYPIIPPKDSKGRPRRLSLPSGAADGDYWAVAGTYDLGIDEDHPKPSPDRAAGDYYAPKGLYLQLRKEDNGFFKLIGLHNEVLVFDGLGRLVSINDRLRQNAEEDEIRGNRIRLHYDGFGRLNRIEDDYNRPYHLSYDEDPDSDSFGLLSELEDFADRKLQYRYKDGETILEEVELPHVRQEALAEGETGEPIVKYSYAPANSSADAVLHGIFSEHRLKGVTLPGRTKERFTLEYEPEKGRVSTVHLAEVDNPWALQWSEEEGQITQLEATAPWGQKSETHVYTEGVGRGRVDRVVAKAVPTLLNTEATPAPDGEIPTKDLETDFDYQLDGSGRFRSITRPDGSLTVMDWRDGLRTTEASILGIDTKNFQGDSGTASYSETIEMLIYDEGGSDNQPSIMVDANGNNHRMGHLSFDGGVPHDAVEGHAKENVWATTSFDMTGRPTKEYLGKGPEENGKTLVEDEVETTWTYAAEEPPNIGGYGYVAKKTLGANGTGLSTEYKYDSYGNPSEARRKDGNTTLSYSTMSYDSWDRPYQEISGQGGSAAAQQAVSTTYDLSGRILTKSWFQDTGSPVVATFEYDERDQVFTEKVGGVAPEEPGGSPIEAVTTHIYSQTNGLLESDVSPAGIVTQYTYYDASNRLSGISRGGVSGTIRRAYDVMGRVVWSTDGDDGVWRGYYDVWGRMYKEEFADGTSILRKFDKLGNMTEEKTISSQTDGGGSPVVLSHTEYELTSYGQPKKMTEHLGVTGDRVTELIIDGAGREKELHRGDGAESRIERKTSYMVDGSGRMYEQLDAENNSTKFGYGGSARPDPTRLIVDGLSYRMDRDARGRTTRTEQLDGGWAINRSFDKVGDLKGQWLDGDISNRVNTTYDSLGNVLTSVGETGDETQYGYDADGRILHQDVLRADDSWERTSYGYDAGGRLSLVSYPDGTSETFTYNSDDTIDLWYTRLVNDVGTPLILKHDYDEMGRLTRRYVNNADAFGVVPEGLAPLDVVGEKFVYDDLGRLNLAAEITAIGGPDEDDQYKDFSAVGYGYLPSDSRTLPWTVTTGGSSYWQIVQSSYGIHDVLESLTNALNNDSVSYSFASDGLNRRKETTPGDGAPINYAWSGLHGLSGMNTGPEGLEVQRHYDPLNLLSSQNFLVSSEAAGGFSFDWNAASGWKQKRSKAADAKLAEGLDWTWSSNTAKRLLLAESSLGNWFFDLGVADELGGVYSPGGIRTTFETGANGRLTGISTQEGEATTTEALSYDGLGRRIADGRNQYDWTWSGRLVGTEVAEYVEDSGGDKVSYVYDATGRLIKRSLCDEFGSFIEAQVFVWNGAELLRQEGRNFLGERLWRAEYLPGPGGLDDSPQVKVTTHMHSSDPEPETTRSFEIVRDEMNSVVAIVERDPAVVILPLKARVLYSPYGKAFLEEGPTLLSVDHEIERTHAGGVSQTPVNFADLDEDGELEPTGVPGALVFDFTYEIDPASLSDGVTVKRYTEDQWAVVEADFAIVVDEEKPSRIVVMPFEPWEHSGQYRIMLDKELMDTSGRSAVFPEDEESYSAAVSIDEILPEEPEKIAGYPQRFPIRFDTAKAAGARLDCGEGIDGPEACFPAGLNMLFQGAYFDPTTGLGYFRARWYDPQTLSWLSEDPAGIFDSPNLYAFVALQPNMNRDPKGEYLESPWDAASLAVGSASLLYNLSEENYNLAAWDAFGVVVDAAALALPVVPGGVGAATKGVRALTTAKKAVRAAQTIQWAGDVGQGIYQSGQAFGAGRYGWGAFYGGLATFGAVSVARRLDEVFLPAPGRGARINLLRSGEIYPEGAAVPIRFRHGRTHALLPSRLNPKVRRWQRTDWLLPSGGPTRFQGHHWWPKELGGADAGGAIVRVASANPNIHTAMGGIHPAMRAHFRQFYGARTWRAARTQFLQESFPVQHRLLQGFYRTQKMTMPEMVAPGILR